MRESEEAGMGGMVLFRLGFRPFFLAGAIFSVISMLVWMGIYLFQTTSFTTVNPVLWHAHEMIYGYGLAVIAGFLLTAVRNWTNIQTLHGLPLQGLFLLWALARIAMLIPGDRAIMFACFFDLAFSLYLSVAVTWPIVRARLWRNMGVVSKVYFLLIGNLIYFLGLLGFVSDGARTGIYIGLYMLLSLLLVLSRRVLPFFIERGVGYSVTLKNSVWVDLAAFLLFLSFAVTDIFMAYPEVTAGLAAALFLLHSIRLRGWYTAGIWRQPLLWSIYIAYIWVILGFALKALTVVLDISLILPVHAFAVGGIGMMTLGMMSRIALGHTGRNIIEPPSGLGAIFTAVCIGAVLRVGFPLFLDSYHNVWIALSQTIWIGAFLGFLYIYKPILTGPRIDGRWG